MKKSFFLAVALALGIFAVDLRFDDENVTLTYL